MPSLSPHRSPPCLVSPDADRVVITITTLKIETTNHLALPLSALPCLLDAALSSLAALPLCRFPFSSRPSPPLSPTLSLDLHSDIDSLWLGSCPDRTAQQAPERVRVRKSKRSKIHAQISTPPSRLHAAAAPARVKEVQKQSRRRPRRDERDETDRQSSKSRS